QPRFSVPLPLPAAGAGDVRPYAAGEQGPYADTDLRNGEYHVRTLLELTLQALISKARRELSAVIGLADERVLHRTLNNPFAPQDLPWWMRRIGV
ncbi:hypothetical protein ACIP80_38325, partial [Streptomyces sp. NPDC088555]|uniref:hypothetical protein n=1 Tax=Streptomyces sp. NPDC088555 TaxID=3365866 RepID=UPI0038234BAE